MQIKLNLHKNYIIKKKGLNQLEWVISFFVFFISTLIDNFTKNKLTLSFKVKII